MPVFIGGFFRSIIGKFKKMRNDFISVNKQDWRMSDDIDIMIINSVIKDK